VFAEGPVPREQQTQLKDLVILIGAQDGNDAFSRTVPPGQVTQPLTFRVAAPAAAGSQQGELVVTEFVAQQEPAQVVPAVLRGVQESPKSQDRRRLPLSLAAAGWIDVELQVGPLRSNTTYKGRLVIAAGSLLHRWDVTLAAGGRGVLSTDGIGPTKLVTFHPCTWFTWVSAAAASCEAETRTFSVTIRDKSEQGPYTALRVRFEPPTGAATKGIASNFSLDALSFWVPNRTGWDPLDLAHRGKDGSGPAGPPIVNRRGQRTIAVRVESLSPGEYAGALRFAADGASDDASESKLGLTLQIRHHWTLPVVVILLGSFVGWFGSKYVVAVRRTRALAQQVQALRARANDLARPGLGRGGWHFPGEAASYALARVRVVLHQLAGVSRSALRVMVADAEIQERSQDAQRRLTGLEKLRAVRVTVESIADGRPAAQLTVGRILRRAVSFLDRPNFGEAEQAELTKALDSLNAWLAPETGDVCYRDGITGRLRGRELPDRLTIDALPHGPLRARLTDLVDGLPSDDAIKQAKSTKLEEYDRRIAETALLWREQALPWAADLVTASAASTPLDKLFRIADTKVWESLESGAKAKQLRVTRSRGGQETVETQDLVEIQLTSNVPDLPDSRMVYHPLRVGWTIISLDGGQRSAETDALTLVQYFPEPGPVRIKTVLLWEGREIPVPDDLTLEVVTNPDYRSRAFFADWSEHAVTGVAVLFAVLTAMSTLYDATFGSFGQYLSLFLWAAGAGAGGNLFKQLGTSASPTAGGQADVALSGGAGSGAPARSQ